MSILSLASVQSTYRGYEYFEAKKVLCFVEQNERQYEGTVAGSNGKTYEVFIDEEHPRKSHCNCPHAAGKRIICKHMIALYFTLHPNEAEQYVNELRACWEEEEHRYEEEEQALLRYVAHMRKSELQQALLQILFDGPEWQYDRFLEEHQI
ncbi:MAG: SWIM zinc finger domain-containing protein [Butyricicoccus sp.]